MELGQKCCLNALDFYINLIDAFGKLLLNGTDLRFYDLADNQLNR